MQTSKENSTRKRKKRQETTRQTYKKGSEGRQRWKLGDDNGSRGPVERTSLDRKVKEKIARWTYAAETDEVNDVARTAA